MQPVSLSKIPLEYRIDQNKHEKPYQSRESRNYTPNNLNKEELYNKYMDAVRIANLKDQELLSIAKADANKDDKYKAKTYTTALIGIPVADTLISGAFSRAPGLSGKLSTMGKVGAGWIGAFALAGLYNGMVDKITAVSPVIKRSEDRHPIISSILRLAGFAAVLVGAHKAISKLATTLPAKLPKTAAILAETKSKAASFINNSSLNKKVITPIKNKIAETAVKHPKVAGYGLTALALSVPALVIGTIFKSITDKNEKSEKIKDTYQNLLAARELNRMQLNLINSGLIANAFNTAIQAEIIDSEMPSKDLLDDNTNQVTSADKSEEPTSSNTKKLNALA